ncbi:MAG TPA: class I SAM-dependent methyltransferase [Alphaproteobacteria bacterium]|nr:class I SAM-dependent methyltransferase [Alphaproteobacteria bacterium]
MASPDDDRTPLDHWNQRFAGEHYHFGTAPNRFLAAHGHLLRPGQRVLAVADGEGRNGVWLAEQGLDVHAVDFSPNALAKSRRLAAERGVTMTHEQADLSQWTWPDAAFDVVAAIFIQFAGPALRERIFAGMQRALKPGGLLLLEGYRPEQLEYRTGGPPHLENLYTEAMLRAAFAAMEITELSAYDAEVQEGPGHHGMSALIDLVARKR